MHSIFITLGSVFAGVGMFVGSLFGYHVPEVKTDAPQTLGAYNPTGGGTYRLQSSVSSTQNTITLSSFKEPISNIPYTMTQLNSSIEYGTLEPQNTTNKEFISFTGITQNSDGTATLTGVSRGMSFSYPYTASTTLQLAHSGQSIFILSNTPQLYKQFATLSNNEWVTGTWGFSVNATSTTDCATSVEYCRKNYIDNLVIAGGVNSSEIIQGIVQLPTNAQVAASTKTGSTGARLALNTLNATSSPFDNGVNIIPVTGSTGKLSPRFIATSSADVGTTGMFWTASTTFSGATTTLAATTTIAAATTTPLILNGVPYALPPTQASASSSALLNDGVGNLSWGSSSSDWRLVASTTVTSAVASTTLAIATTTGGTYLHVIAYFPAGSAISDFCIQFDGDAGNNYGNRIIFGTTSVDASSKSCISLINNFIQSTGASQVDLVITNVGNRIKVGTINAVGSGGSATDSFYVLGSFIWNYLTSPINKITFGAGASNIAVGAQISVFASSQ